MCTTPLKDGIRNGFETTGKNRQCGYFHKKIKTTIELIFKSVLKKKKKTAENRRV